MVVFDNMILCLLFRFLSFSFSYPCSDRLTFNSFEETATESESPLTHEYEAQTYKNKTLRSVHFGVVFVELINCKCGGIVRNQIW